MNNDPVQINRILRRAKQGVTRPFLCAATNGERYWLKGRNTGMAGLCHEWIAGRMAKAFGLPVPDMQMVEVRENLIKGSVLPDANELGTGIAFASRHVEANGDLWFATVGKVPEELRLKILVFDAWVRNEDRSLGTQGGNVNLLWHNQRKQIWVIDHNNAFDPGFQLENFLEHHVFRDSLWSSVFDPPKLLAFTLEMKEIERIMVEIICELPEAWREVAETHSSFSIETIRKSISNHESVLNTLRHFHES